MDSAMGASGRSVPAMGIGRAGLGGQAWPRSVPASGWLSRLRRWFRAAEAEPGADKLLAVPLPAWRSHVLLFGLFAAFAALAVRAFVLQGGVSTPFLKKEGAARYSRVLEIPATRGRILDRNGNLLATSLPARVFWAIPEQVDAGPGERRALARLLGVGLDELTQRLDDDDRSFVVLRHGIDVDLASQIDALHIHGVHSSAESRRYYPQGPMAAQLIGMTRAGEHGQEGVELAFDSTLAGVAGQRGVLSDNLRRVVEEEWLRPPVDGRDLELAVDQRIQSEAFTALKEGAARVGADYGSVVVLDVQTGEILALANWPSYDPNDRNGLVADRLNNRAVTDVFEPGSTMKTFSVSAAIEAGVVTPQTLVQTGNGRIVIAGHTITDSHPIGLATVEKVVAESSNVGATRIALQMPPQPIWEMYNRAGFGQPVDAGFARTTSGRLRPVETWTTLQQASASFGYGLSVSLLQLAHAYLAVAREGDMPSLSLVRRDVPGATVQVMKPRTAHAMRHILEKVVSPEGTALAARIPGYTVAGKTGTSRKASHGTYSGAYDASFIGFAPVARPRVLVAVMYDNPRAGHIYGGDAAAPVFARIEESALRAMQVPPDEPVADARGSR